MTSTTLSERTAAWMAAIEPWSRGRSLPPLDGAALMVVDVQRFFAEPDSHAYLPALGAVLPRILWLIKAFGAARRPVVLTSHCPQPDQASLMRRWWRDPLCQGDPRARLVQPLEELDADRLLSKSHYSAFCDTDLEAWLKTRQCDTLVICGVQTHLCCETTAREAFMRDLAPVVVADACAAPDEELHLGSLRNLAHGFAVISTADQLASALGASRLSGDRPCSQAPARQTQLAVIGAGPAGLAAAIQAKRSGLDVTLLDPDPPGGQARTAECIENYPGFPGGIPGDQLMQRFVAQARQLELKVHPKRTVAVEMTGHSFKLTLEGQTRSLTAAAVIVASGSTPRGLGQLSGHNVVHRVDALDRTLSGQRILVVGGGEAALDQAIYAKRRGAQQVTVVIRGQAPRAMSLLVDRAQDRGIQLLCETEVEGMTDAGQIQLRRRGDSMTLPVDAAVVCIGKDAALPRLPRTLARSANGLPETDSLGRTSLPGLYLVGDVRRGRYRQVAIAVGDGVAAAMHVADFLRSGIERD